jgi:hypothetical protein
MRSAARILPLVCGFVTLTAAALGADEKPPKRSTHGADCQLCYEGASGLELAVPLWLPLVGIKGVEPKGIENPQHVIADPQLEFAIVAEAHARFGPVGFALSAYGASLGSQVVRSETDESLGTVDLDAYFGHATIDWYTPPYRLGLGRRPPLFAIWPFMGARYVVLSGEGSDPDQKLLFAGTKKWGEPLFGMRFLVDLRRGWLLTVIGDVGGFNVGSEISARASAELQYAVADWLNFRIGWLLFYARFPIGEADETPAELLMQGPGLGFGIPLF